MMRRALAVLVFALTAEACGPPDVPYVCETVRAADETFPTNPVYEDEKFLVDLVDTIPGFGGTYVMPDQMHLVVLLVEPSDALANEARDALVELYGERAWRDNPATPQETLYDYRELWRFRQRSGAVFGLRDVQTVYIDHFTGTLTWGVLSEDAKSCVEENLRALDIPEEAFRVEIDEPIVPL